MHIFFNYKILCSKVSKNFFVNFWHLIAAKLIILCLIFCIIISEYFPVLPNIFMTNFSTFNQILNVWCVQCLFLFSAIRSKFLSFLSFYIIYKGDNYHPVRRYYYDIFSGTGCSGSPCGINAVCRESTGGRPGMAFL